jgi:hypothetical protein
MNNINSNNNNNNKKKKKKDTTLFQMFIMILFGMVCCVLGFKKSIFEYMKSAIHFE